MNDEWKERIGPVAAVVIAGVVVVYLALEAIGLPWLPTAQGSRRVADGQGSGPIAATALPTEQPLLLPSATATPGSVAPAPISDTATARPLPSVATPTSTSNDVVPTPTVADVAPLSFHPVFEAHFSDPETNWPNDPRSTAWLADGAYHLLARQPTRFVAIGAPITTPLGDVAVTAAFRKLGGPPGGGYGVIVRDEGAGPRDGLDQGGQYYVLEVSDRGEVGMWRRQEDHWVDLLPWAPSAAVLPGDAVNELRLQAIGEHLTLQVNGTQVARLDDSALARGGVGVFVGGDMNEVALERFVVTAPDEPPGQSPD